MLGLAIHFLEAFVLSLVAFLGYKVFSLAREEEQTIVREQVDLAVQNLINITPKKKQKQNYEEKMESLKMAQVFAGAQMIEIKRSIDNLQEEQLEWLREAISLYLIGAVDFIGRQTNCTVSGRQELIQVVLKSNLRLSQEYVSEYVTEAIHRKPQSEHDHMVRAGAKAAKFWLKQDTVPSNFSLRSQLDDWGVFA